MDRIQLPPHHKEPAEDIGERVIQKLLDTPDSPKTLEEDLLETSVRIAQRNIALLQGEMAAQESLMLKKIVSQAQECLEQRPHINREEKKALETAVTNFAQQQVNALREHTDLLIMQLHMEQEKRNANIRTFCSLPSTHSTAPAA